jgi:hypothetical protein
MRRSLIAFVCLVGCFLLAGCGNDSVVAGTPATVSKVNTGGLSTVSRYVDAEAGVVCWLLKTGYAGGISCLPIDETRLELQP